MNINNLPTVTELKENDTKAKMSMTEVEEAKNLIQFVFLHIPDLKCKFFNQQVKTRSTCKISKEQFQRDLEESVNNHSFFLSFDQLFSKYFSRATQETIENFWKKTITAGALSISNYCTK